MMKKNITVEYKTEEGDVIEMTLSFLHLLNLQHKYPDAYKNLNDYIISGMKDVFDNFKVLYAGYLCKQIELKNDDVLSNKEFMDQFEFDVRGIAEMAAALLGFQKASSRKNSSGKR